MNSAESALLLYHNVIAIEGFKNSGIGSCICAASLPDDTEIGINYSAVISLTSSTKLQIYSR